MTDRSLSVTQCQFSCNVSQLQMHVRAERGDAFVLAPAPRRQQETSSRKSRLLSPPLLLPPPTRTHTHPNSFPDPPTTPQPATRGLEAGSFVCCQHRFHIDFCLCMKVCCRVLGANAATAGVVVVADGGYWCVSAGHSTARTRPPGDVTTACE